MSHCVALMYHALYDNEEEHQALLDEEKPYAISTQVFEQHLQMLKRWQHQVLEPCQLANTWQPGVFITFDDGHRSHFTHALPILRRHNMSAVFFVTTDFMSEDPRFCSWPELHQMHQQGMSIQAHGQTHQFFADMSEQQAKDELHSSFVEITTHVATPFSMSFPGGRYQARDLQLAHQQGFSHLFTSDVDQISPAAFTGVQPIPRFAIRNTTTIAQLQQMTNPSRGFLFRQKTIARLKKTLKSLLGNQGYHLIYALKAKIWTTSQ